MSYYHITTDGRIREISRKDYDTYRHYKRPRLTVCVDSFVYIEQGKNRLWINRKQANALARLLGKEVVK